MFRSHNEVEIAQVGAHVDKYIDNSHWYIIMNKRKADESKKLFQCKILTTYSGHFIYSTVDWDIEK